MFPPALALFLLACAGGLYRAWARGQRMTGGLMAAVNAALAVYEYSFTLAPVREWIRVDLLITLPLACACLVTTGVLAYKSPR